MNDNSRTKSNKQKLLLSSQKIKDMFKQVSTHIQHLLDNIAYIYEFHGVDYHVSGYYSTILKILSPVELLWQYRQSQNRHQNEKSSHLTNLKKISHPANRRTEPKEQHAVRDIFPKIEKTTQYNSNENNELLGQLSERQKTKPHKNGNQNPFNYSRTSLSQEDQIRICEWMKERASYGKSVSKIDIMRQAKMMSRDTNFQASSGWFRRFLNRHEDARIILEMNRFIPETHYQKSQNDAYSKKKGGQRSGQEEDWKYSAQDSYADIVQWQSVDQKGKGHKEKQFDKISDFSGDSKRHQAIFSQVVNRLQGAVKNHQQEIYLQKKDNYSPDDIEIQPQQDS